MAEASGGGGAATDVDIPSPTTSDDLDIWCTLDHVLIIQATHGQNLVAVPDEVWALHVELGQFQQSSSPPPFDDGFWLPFGILSQKGGVYLGFKHL